MTHSPDYLTQEEFQFLQQEKIRSRPVPGQLNLLNWFVTAGLNGLLT